MLKLIKPLVGGLCLTALTLLVACQSVEQKPAAQREPPRIRYDAEYDRQIRDVFDLANRNRWEEASAKADQLYLQAPTDPAVTRLHDWVLKQKQIRREEAIEDKIRQVDSKNNTAFNPNPGSLLTEQKDRGLPPRKDIRDTVEKIENAPYIPETYGKVITEKGPMFEFESATNRMAKLLDKEITIKVDGIPLEALLLNVSQSSGINFVADKSLSALTNRCNVSLDKVKLSEFLRHLSRNYKLQFQVGPELVWVVDATNTNSVMEETRFYRLRKGFILPAELGVPEATVQIVTGPNNVVTRTETQKYQKFVNDAAPPIPAIERAITNLFTGKYLIDYERNLIVARGTPEQLDVIERIIKEFDQPIQQVLIEARFVTIAKPAYMQLGALWSNSGSAPAVPGAQDYTGLVPLDNVPNLGTGLQKTWTLSRAGLSATLSALEQTGESQTLSAPRLTVLNNRPASISDGQVQYYYDEYQVLTTPATSAAGLVYSSSSFVPSGKPTQINAGATLNVLASISGDGQSIVLALNPTVNTQVRLTKYATLTQFFGQGQQSTFDINLPTYTTDELATRVVVKSGETVVMGGVLQRQRSTFVESIPGLGNIPVLGALFRRRTEVDAPRYLLIFVTATIVKDNGEFLVYDDGKGVKK